MKRALVFVASPTHFKEMIRVARLLNASAGYDPIVLFASEYGGWERDAAICRNAGIAVHSLQLGEYGLTWVERGGPGAGSVSTEAPPAAAQGSLSGHLPEFMRPHVRGIWRATYKAYWNIRGSIWVQERVGRLKRLWLYSVFPARLLLSYLLSKRVPEIAAGTGGSPDVHGRRTALGRGLLAALGEIWSTSPDSLPAELAIKRHLHRLLPDLLRQHRIELIVVPEDNYHLHTNIFVDAAHRVGAPAVIVPFTIANSLEWAEGFFPILNAQVRWPPNLLMARAFPHWVYEHKGRKLIMPALEILVNEYLGLAPPRPWLLNSGFADALAVGGAHMADYYARAGIDKAQIALTGSLADDELHARLLRPEDYRARLYDSLDLPGGKPMLLIAIPPNQLRGDGRSECEFQDYEELLRAILRVACGCEGWNVVLSLHPRVYRAEVKFIQEYPCEVADDDIASLVPLCDLFVASASATIQLAAAAGKPVVNYDVFQYHYSDYDNVPGVLTVSDYREFAAQVRSLTQDPARLATLAEQQRQFAAEHTLVDGRSGERMLSLFDRLIEDRMRTLSASLSHRNHVG